MGENDDPTYKKLINDIKRILKPTRMDDEEVQFSMDTKISSSEDAQKFIDNVDSMIQKLKKVVR